MPAYPIPPEDRKSYEEKGEAYVRLVWGGAAARNPVAKAWLAELDEAARKRTEALQAEQTRLAENTLKAAWIAVYAALGAIAVGILTWIFPLH